MCSVYGNSSSLAGVIFCLDLELKMSLTLSRNTLSWHFLCAPVASVLAALMLQSCSEPSTYGLAPVTSMSLTQAAGPEKPQFSPLPAAYLSQSKLTQSHRKVPRCEGSAGELSRVDYVLSRRASGRPSDQALLRSFRTTSPWLPSSQPRPTPSPSHCIPPMCTGSGHWACPSCTASL